MVIKSGANSSRSILSIVAGVGCLFFVGRNLPIFRATDLLSFVAPTMDWTITYYDNYSNNYTAGLERNENVIETQTRVNDTIISHLGATTHNATTLSPPLGTRILGFGDHLYKDHAILWYEQLAALGYTEHVIVATSQQAVEWFQANNHTIPHIRWEPAVDKPCSNQKPQVYRRQLFARRWVHIYRQLKLGYHVLTTDVDNSFSRYIPMQTFEQRTDIDIFHSHSDAYPLKFFYETGIVICGCLAWVRSTPKVLEFLEAFLDRCKCFDREMDACGGCHCDDQRVLNALMTEKDCFPITWNRHIPKPNNTNDLQWDTLTGVAKGGTGHRVEIWNRTFAYRGPVPNSCPKDNWVGMPTGVERGHVIEVWSQLCSNNETITSKQ